jgi:maleate isomerase
MRDFYAQRKMFGIITPSANSCVQPETDAMRPMGVTNQLSRMYTADLKVASDADFAKAMDLLFESIGPAVDSVITSKPDHLILGISALTVWGGSLAAAQKLKQDIIDRAGGNLDVTLPSDAILAALKKHQVKKRIAIVEPYYPVIQPRMESFFKEAGYEVVKINHLKGSQFSQYTRVSSQYLIDAIRSIDGEGVEALIQFGANLPLAGIADEAERWLNKPVIAVNIATYWHALRTCGLQDQMKGFTRLMSEF